MERIPSSDIDFEIKLMDESDYSRLSDFSCGEKELDEFFKYEIKECVTHHFLAAYIVFISTGEIIGAFTLMNDAVMITDHSEKEDFIDDLSYISSSEKIDFFTRQNSFPAINIGHLGIIQSFQGKGIGSAILDFVTETFTHYKQAGCQFITVDALNKRKITEFYCLNGFYFQTNRDFSASTRRMYKII